MRSATPTRRPLALFGAALLAVTPGLGGAQQDLTPLTPAPEATAQPAPLLDLTDPQPAPEAAAAAPAEPPAATGAVPAPGEAAVPANDYLDAVRAQRRALMEEAKARRETEDRPPPSYDPNRRDAYREEMEKQRDAWRDALRERQEWHDQANRWRRYWNNPYGAYLDDLHDQRQRAMEAQADARREQMEKMRQEMEKMRPDPEAWPTPPMPLGPYAPGWPSPWYYPY